jgi:hypothetical protein
VSQDIATALRALPSHTEGSVRARDIDTPLGGLDIARDCGLAVNRAGWWNRTPKGDDYLANLDKKADQP